MATVDAEGLTLLSDAHCLTLVMTIFCSDVYRLSHH